MSDIESIQERNSDINSSELATESSSSVKAKIIISIYKTLNLEDPIDYIRLGKEKIEKKLFDVAVVYLDRAIELDENLSEAYFYRDYAKKELQLYEESISEFKATLKINPKDVATLYQYSYTLCSLNKLDEALIIVNQLVEFDPSQDAYIHRASIKSYMGDHIGSKLDKEKAGELSQDFSVF